MQLLSERNDGADLAQLESVWTSLSPSLHAMVVASIAICESAASPIEQYDLRMCLARLSSATGDGLARARASALAALPSEPGNRASAASKDLVLRVSGCGVGSTAAGRG